MARRAAGTARPAPPGDPADLRAAVARDGRRHYVIAAQAEIHPATLAGMLSGRVPLRANLVERLLRVVAPSP
jgi:hypothetical protein